MNFTFEPWTSDELEFANNASRNHCEKLTSDPKDWKAIVDKNDDPLMITFIFKKDKTWDSTTPFIFRQNGAQLLFAEELTLFSEDFDDDSEFDDFVDYLKTLGFEVEEQ